MKILLLSDSTMNANAGGLSQTLYNIFLFADTANLLCIAPRSALAAVPPSEPYNSCYLSYSFDIIPTPKNRLAKFLMPFARWFNYSFNSEFRTFSSIKKKIAAFNPDIVVSCSNGAMGLFMHFKLLKGVKIKKVFPYFMDDWMHQDELTWLGGSTHVLAKRILAENTSWLMISSDLATILSERYQVIPSRLLEIHNPVDLSDAPNPEPVKCRQKITLAYAGSLWDMHFDSFYVVAQAVSKLKKTINVDLILYTTESFWNWRKAALAPLGVVYGGNIPYSQIHQQLAKADALILCSSFTKEWYTHSKGSVQTKITDYLKSKRLIISCGPDYSANHNFLKRHDCGICIEKNDIFFVESQLRGIFENIEAYQTKVNNGWRLLEDEFTFGRVQDKLLTFVKETNE